MQGLNPGLLACWSFGWLEWSHSNMSRSNLNNWYGVEGLMYGGDVCLDFIPKSGYKQIITWRVHSFQSFSYNKDMFHFCVGIKFWRVLLNNEFWNPCYTSTSWCWVQFALLLGQATHSLAHSCKILEPKTTIAYPILSFFPPSLSKSWFLYFCFEKCDRLLTFLYYN